MTLALTPALNPVPLVMHLALQRPREPVRAAAHHSNEVGEAVIDARELAECTRLEDGVAVANADVAIDARLALYEAHHRHARRKHVLHGAWQRHRLDRGSDVLEQCVCPLPWSIELQSGPW